MNSPPKNIFVLIMAKMSRPFEILYEKICVIINVDAIKITNISRENCFTEFVIIKNHKEIPEDTASDLNLGEDNSMLNRINECHESSLCECSNAYQCNHTEYNWKQIEFSFTNN